MSLFISTDTAEYAMLHPHVSTVAKNEQKKQTLAPERAFLWDIFGDKVGRDVHKSHTLVQVPVLVSGSTFVL